MSRYPVRLATALLALGLAGSGVMLGATASAPTLPHTIAPFGCFT
jgi:hypothetical protein